MIMKEFFGYILISFVSAVVLLLLSKAVMQKLLRRDPGYYEDIEAEEERMMLADVKTAGDDTGSAGSAEDDGEGEKETTR